METYSNWIEAQCVREFLYIHIKARSEKTQREYQTQLFRFILACCRNWSVSPTELDFGSCVILKYKDRELLTELQRCGVNEYLMSIPSDRSRAVAARVLSGYFDYLVGNGILHSNPLPKEQYRSARSVRKQGLTLAEIERFIGILYTRQMPMKAAIIIQLAAGLRVGELCALRMSDIERDLTGGWKVSICRESLKSRKAWQVPLPDLSTIIYEYFEWRQANDIWSEYLFSRPSGLPFTSSMINREIREIGQLANCSRTVTSHDMRRGYATLCNEFIQDPEINRRLTRHKQETTWWRYVREPISKVTENAIKTLPVSKIATMYAMHHDFNRATQDRD